MDSSSIRKSIPAVQRTRYVETPAEIESVLPKKTSKKSNYHRIQSTLGNGYQIMIILKEKKLIIQSGNGPQFSSHAFEQGCESFSGGTRKNPTKNVKHECPH